MQHDSNNDKPTPLENARRLLKAPRRKVVLRDGRYYLVEPEKESDPKLPLLIVNPQA